MPDSQFQKLNALLVDLGRSLLQYSREASLWTDANSTVLHSEVESLAERQSQLVADIADWLNQHGWPVDFGVYPAAYTDLHYVSLAHLMDEIVSNARQITAAVEAVRQQFATRSEMSDLLDHILAEQKAITALLHQLNTKQPVNSADRDVRPTAG